MRRHFWVTVLIHSTKRPADLTGRSARALAPLTSPLPASAVHGAYAPQSRAQPRPLLPRRRFSLRPRLVRRGVPLVAARAAPEPHSRRRLPIRPHPRRAYHDRARASRTKFAGAAACGAPAEVGTLRRLRCARLAERAQSAGAHLALHLSLKTEPLGGLYRAHVALGDGAAGRAVAVGPCNAQPTAGTWLEN